MGKYSKAYMCVGGPLDKTFVKEDDFRDARYSSRLGYTIPAGQFEHFANEYSAFNSAGGRRNKKRHTMIWIHNSLLEVK